MPEFGISDEERKKQRENLAKRSAAGMEKRYADQNRELLENAERLNAPPVTFVSQCYVCQSEHRLWIERQLMKGRSYSAIARALPPHPETGHIIDRRSISRHSKEHMDIDSAAVRAELEDEANLLGQNIEEGIKGAFTNRGALNILIRKAYDDALNGITTVEPRDLIQMIKLYNEMEGNNSTTIVEEAKMAVNLFMEAIQTVIADRFELDQANDILREIGAEVSRLRQRDAIEVEVERNLKTLPRAQV